MIAWILENLKRIGVLLTVITFLEILGTAFSLAINPLWIYLTDLFIIVRKGAMIFNFTWDMPALLICATIAFSLWGAYWAWKGFLFIKSYFD